ncbi:MAG: hypothetical protein Q9159_002812 [Coniocarpon cinnabarinum]
MDWLGFPAVPSVSASGSVQGRKADLKYERHPRPKLSWKLHDLPEQEHVIESDAIIGIVPVNQHLQDDYSLLYVELDASQTSHPAERTFFRTIIINKPPPDLITDFTPSGRSCWQLKHDNDFAGRFRDQIEAGQSPVHVVLSTQSGFGHADKVYENLIKPFLLHNGCAAHTVHRTTSTDSIGLFCKTLAKPAGEAGKSMMIILVSGDGGVVDLVNGMLPATTEGDAMHSVKATNAKFEPQHFGLVPVGTGNALAHSSKLSLDRTLGMSALMRGYLEFLPVFTVRFSPPATVVQPAGDGAPSLPSREQAQRVTEVFGAVVFSWALHAALVADSDTPAYRKLGAERFKVAAGENLFPPGGGRSHAYRGKLLLQRSGHHAWEEVSRNTHSYVLATLCSKLEENFTISPASQPLDGRLRVLHFGPRNDNPSSMVGDRIVGLMEKAYDGGKHVSDADVGYEEIGSLRLEMNEDDDETVDESHAGPGRWRRVCVDGKIFACEPGTIIEVTAQEKDRPKVLKMVSGSFLE